MERIEPPVPSTNLSMTCFGFWHISPNRAHACDPWPALRANRDVVAICSAARICSNEACCRGPSHH